MEPEDFNKVLAQATEALALARGLAVAAPDAEAPVTRHTRVLAGISIVKLSLLRRIAQMPPTASPYAEFVEEVATELLHTLSEEDRQNFEAWPLLLDLSGALGHTPPLSQGVAATGEPLADDLNRLKLELERMEIVVSEGKTVAGALETDLARAALGLLFRSKGGRVGLDPSDGSHLPEVAATPKMGC